MLLFTSTLLLAYRVVTMVPGLSRSVRKCEDGLRRRWQRAARASVPFRNGAGGASSSRNPELLQKPAAPQPLAPTEQLLLHPDRTRSDVAAAGGGTADGASDAGSDESTVSQALRRLPWHRRRMKAAHPLSG